MVFMDFRSQYDYELRLLSSNRQNFGGSQATLGNSPRSVDGTSDVMKRNEKLDAV
jgi:hypothetical protein